MDYLIKWGLILFLMLAAPVHAVSLDFSHYLAGTGDIPLAVTGVEKGDVLNVRESADHTSKVIYQLPPDSTNLISFDQNIADKLGKNVWIPVRIGFDEGYLNGYVKAVYVKLPEEYEQVSHAGITVNKPYFLEYDTQEKEALKLYKSRSFLHHSGCDMRDDPAVVAEWMSFNVVLKAYRNHKAMLLELFSYEKEQVLQYHDEQTNWFSAAADSGDYFRKVSMAGEQGYQYTTGAEGCGLNYYFFKKGDSILLLTEYFDHNPPIALDTTAPKLRDWATEDKERLLAFLLEQSAVEP